MERIILVMALLLSERGITCLQTTCGFNSSDMFFESDKMFYTSD